MLTNANILTPSDTPLARHLPHSCSLRVIQKVMQLFGAHRMAKEKALFANKKSKEKGAFCFPKRGEAVIEQSLMTEGVEIKCTKLNS